MYKQRVLMVATTPSMIGQFNMNNIDILRNLGYEVDVATDFDDTSYWPIKRIQKFKKELYERGVKTYQLDFSRSPLRIAKHIASYREIVKLIREREYAFIHTHTPIASAIVRIAAHKTKTKVIYTAHGFHFYTGAPLKNWLLFYPIEWLCSWWTDILITINKEDYKRAGEHLHAKKTVYVPGVGVDTEKFKPRKNGRERIRRELRLKDDQIMLLSVGEVNENKNHETVVKALSNLNSSYNSSSSATHNRQENISEFAECKISKVVYIIVGNGILTSKIQELGKKYNIDIRLMGYRNDVADFYDAADVYVLPSYREGLNVSLMEAMASKLSIICGKIRGNIDLIEDKACLFDPSNIEEIKKSIVYAIENREKLGQENFEKIKNFDFRSVQYLVSEIYSENITPPPTHTRFYK